VGVQWNFAAFWFGSAFLNGFFLEVRKLDEVEDE
jgi:hypothetical protein